MAATQLTGIRSNGASGARMAAMWIHTSVTELLASRQPGMFACKHASMIACLQRLPQRRHVIGIFGANEKRGFQAV